ncbi:hypothetical protein K1W54_24935 [Micromonospora sp. CPCC 205371]|nr:hypothetical protein [Micromonospora sp. CPCC 205371]
MVFEIVVDGDRRDMVLLRDWLIASPSIRRNANVRLAAPADVPGAMGSTVDAITVVADTLLTAGSLLVAIAGWRHTRRVVTSVTIRHGDVEVTISGTDQSELDDAIRRLDAARLAGTDGGR